MFNNQDEVVINRIHKYSLWILAFALSLLSFNYGTSWDERMSIKYSQDLWNYFTSFGQDRTCLNNEIKIYSHLIYYGNIFGLISTALGKFLPFNIIDIRHVLCSFFGFLSIFYSCKISKILGGNKLAILTIILLLLSPRFIGHIMNGFRDTTFMLGYIATVYYLIKFWIKLPRFDFKTSSKLAFAIFFTSSVRIGGLICLFLLFIISLIWILKNRKIIDQLILKKFVLHLSFISIMSYVMIVLIWPWSHGDILSRPISALFEFSDLQLIVSYQLFNGNLIPNRNVPWSYLFVWIGITTPIVVLAGIVPYIPFIKNLIKNNFNELLIIALSVIIPLTLYLLRARNLYDSWRHFLFLAPLITILSAYGWNMFYKKFHSKKLKKGILFTLSILLIFPLYSQFKFFPNQTNYFNELIGGISGAQGKYEIDIDGNVMRALTVWLNAHSDSLEVGNQQLATNVDPLSITQYLNNRTTANEIKWIPNDQLYYIDWKYALISSRTLSKYELRPDQWPLKESVYDYKIDGITIASVIRREDWSGKLGLERINTGRYEDAIDFFKRATSLNPTVESYYRYLGLAYIRTQNYDLAEIALKKGLQLNRDNTFIQYYLGELEFYKGNYRKSLTFLEKAKDRRLNNYSAYCLEAKNYYLMNNFEKSKSLLDELLNEKYINGKDLSLICTTYGELYYSELEKSNYKCKSCFESAIEYFEKAVNYNPKNAQPYLITIELYQRIGNDKDADTVRQIMMENLK